MKKFIVDTGDKKYKVEANTYDEAVSAVKAIQLKDEASPLQTVNALLEDERAAVDAYNVALENLKGKIPDESYAAIEAIRNDENRHIENLQAVVNGNVTEKNLKDSVKDEKIKAGAEFKSKSGHKIKIVSVDSVEFSPFDGSVVVKFTYDYEMTDGKKGRSAANNVDLYRMLKE